MVTTPEKPEETPALSEEGADPLTFEHALVVLRQGAAHGYADRQRWGVDVWRGQMALDARNAALRAWDVVRAQGNPAWRTHGNEYLRLYEAGYLAGTIFLEDHK